LHESNWIVEEGNQLQKRTIDEVLTHFLWQTDKEKRKGTNAALSVLPAFMMDGIGSKGKHFALVLRGVIFENCL